MIFVWQVVRRGLQVIDETGRKRWESRRKDLQSIFPEGRRVGRRGSCVIGEFRVVGGEAGSVGAWSNRTKMVGFGAHVPTYYILQKRKR